MKKMPKPKPGPSLILLSIEGSLWIPGPNQQGDHAVLVLRKEPPPKGQHRNSLVLDLFGFHHHYQGSIPANELARAAQAQVLQLLASPN